MDPRLPNQSQPQTPQSSYDPRPVSSPPPPPPPAPAPSKGKGLVIRAILGLFLLLVFLFALWKIIPHLLPKSQEKVTLSYWGLWEDEGILKPIFADFERTHPNITVSYTRQDPTQYRERLLTRMNNGTGPDLYRFHDSWTPMLVSDLLPLSSDVVSANDLKNNYYPTVAQDTVRNGAILGLPLDMDTLSLFTNNEIFQAAGVQVPTSWDDFVKAARQLTVKDENGKIRTAGTAMGTYDNVEHASDIMSLLFLQNGVPLTRIAANPAKAAEALEFYTAFAKGSDTVWDDTLDPSTLAFAKGNLAMYFGYSWDIFTIKSLNSNLQFSVHPVPALPGRAMTIASYWLEGVSSKTKHPKEAMELLKYLSQKDTLQKIYTEEAKTREFGELYPRPDLADTLKNDAEIYPFLEQAPNAVSTPFSSDTKDSGLNAELNGYLGNAIRSALGNSSTDTAVQTLIQGQNQVIGRYGQ